MRGLLAIGFAATISLLAAALPANAQVINAFDLNFSTTSPADYNGAGTQINFPGNATGTAFINLTLAAGNYTLNVSGQTNNNSRFRITFGAQTIVALADLMGNGNDIQTYMFSLANNTNANLTFTPVALRTNANFEGHLDARRATVAVPVPVAGAGIPALLGVAGVWLARRRRLRPAA